MLKMQYHGRQRFQNRHSGASRNLTFAGYGPPAKPHGKKRCHHGRRRANAVLRRSNLVLPHCPLHNQRRPRYRLHLCRRPARRRLPQYHPPRRRFQHRHIRYHQRPRTPARSADSRTAPPPLGLPCRSLCSIATMTLPAPAARSIAPADVAHAPFRQHPVRQIARGRHLMRPQHRNIHMTAPDHRKGVRRRKIRHPRHRLAKTARRR